MDKANQELQGFYDSNKNPVCKEGMAISAHTPLLLSSNE